MGNVKIPLAEQVKIDGVTVAEAKGKVGPPSKIMIGQEIQSHQFREQLSLSLLYRFQMDTVL